MHTENCNYLIMILKFSDIYEHIQITRYIHVLTCPCSLYWCQASTPLITETSSHVSCTTTVLHTQLIAMILRISLLIVATLFVGNTRADVAPEITTLAEGYNIVAKLPCLGCPFLYQDSASGQDEGWKVREDENALVSRNVDFKLSFSPRSL
jgi:hypothetical protein